MSAGAIFAVFGAVFLAASMQFEIGSARQMGPGYFPLVLSALLVLLGIAHMVRTRPAGPLAAAAVAASRHPPYRVSLCVLGGLALFAFTLERLGLVVATVLLVAIAGVAAPGRRWIDVAAMAAGLAAFSTVVFVRLLGLPIPVWPGGW